MEERHGLLTGFVCLFKLNLGFVKGAPVLLALLAITLCGGLASEGFDRLSTAHFLDDTVIPVIGPLNSVTWFGVISLIGSGLGILASQLLIARMEKKGTVSRTSVVMSTSAGISCAWFSSRWGGAFGSCCWCSCWRGLCAPSRSLCWPPG